MVVVRVSVRVCGASLETSIERAVAELGTRRVLDKTEAYRCRPVGHAARQERVVVSERLRLEVTIGTPPHNLKAIPLSSRSCRA